MYKKIVIANTLKPVDDVRAYEKIAQSLAKTNKYEINIIGNEGKKESGHSMITFTPHSLSRTSYFKRIFIRVKILLNMLRVRPDILVITTYELLNAAILVKLFCGSQIIYDVQEDYKKNILSLSKFPWIMRILLGNIVRLKERILSPAIDTFWLAEKCYLYEISFSKSKSVMIENKAQSIQQTRTKTSAFKVLFSGTLSHFSNVLLAIETYLKLREHLTNPMLYIIGQCHDRNLQKKLQELAVSHDDIQLNISEEIIPHESILSEILSSDLGIISYQENEVNKNKIPTKLYEYARYQLPYLVQGNTEWERKSVKLGYGIPVDFNRFDAKSALQRVENVTESSNKPFPEDETWESQEALLINSLID